MALDDLRLGLELQYGDGLVHLRCQTAGLLVDILCTAREFRHELRAGIVGVGLHGERGQWNEVDSVAILQGGEVGIAQREADDVADAGVIAGRGSHPENVVVAPDHVPVVIVGEQVHDEVGAGTAVEDVAEDMQLVDDETLDHVGQGDDEVVGAPRGDDGADDLVHVAGLVGVLRALVEKFLDDVTEVFGQRLAHLRAGVLARHVAADSHQAVERDVVPVVDVGLRSLHQFKLLLGIVDQRAEFPLLALAEAVAEKVVHLALDVTRGILQHVLESFVFSVDVGKEVLGAFRQVQYGLQVDDLGAGFGYRGEAL